MREPDGGGRDENRMEYGMRTRWRMMNENQMEEDGMRT
jgi:hypothetical protein